MWAEKSQLSTTWKGNCTSVSSQVFDYFTQNLSSDCSTRHNKRSASNTVSSNQKQHLNVTCPTEGGDGAKWEGSAKASRQRGGGRLPFARTVLAVDELGQVGRQGGDKGVFQGRREQRRSTAEVGGCGATCKVSATQEQHNSLLPEITVLTKLSKVSDYYKNW